ncbi:hypothetical protein P7C70_g7582, partial [Phenoliferia sp. Uapishka_3]
MSRPQPSLDRPNDQRNPSLAKNRLFESAIQVAGSSARTKRTEGNVINNTRSIEDDVLAPSPGSAGLAAHRDCQPHHSQGERSSLALIPGEHMTQTSPLREEREVEYGAAAPGGPSLQEDSLTPNGNNVINLVRHFGSGVTFWKSTSLILFAVLCYISFFRYGSGSPSSYASNSTSYTERVASLMRLFGSALTIRRVVVAILFIIVLYLLYLLYLLIFPLDRPRAVNSTSPDHTSTSFYGTMGRVYAVLFSLLAFAAIGLLFYDFYADVDKAIERDQILAEFERGQCSSEYTKNLCEHAPPAFVQQCKSWKRCSLEMPLDLGRTGVIARIVAKNVDSFFSHLSYHTVAKGVASLLGSAKAVAAVLPPSAGSAALNGSVAALLE